MIIRKKNNARKSVVDRHISSKDINEYANSMFRHEYLNEQWLTACAGYLYSLFGDSLKGKTVIDYAFGRGNWSVAFSRIGVAKVIAMDASADNVLRFSSYCSQNKIDNIEVIQGNILEKSVDLFADFFWIYGILNNIQNPPLFLSKLIHMARDDRSQFFIYHYDARSLRQFVVESCRKIITYRDEASFIRDSYLYVPAARMRARDDLTAPYVTFSKAQELDSMLTSNGIFIRRSCRSFQEFQTGAPTPEFDPYHYLCDVNKKERNKVRDEPRAFLKDINILREMVESLYALDLPSITQKKLAIGLYNTHFASLVSPNDVTPVIRNDFLFLFYAIIKNDIAFDLFSPVTRRCLKSAARSLNGEKMETKTSDESKTYIHKSYLLDFLNSNNIRI